MLNSSTYFLSCIHPITVQQNPDSAWVVGIELGVGNIRNHQLTVAVLQEGLKNENKKREGGMKKTEDRKIPLLYKIFKMYQDLQNS